MTVVMKFGGTSVADADAISRLAAIVRRQINAQTGGDRPPIVVVSALSKVTDTLIESTRLAVQEEADRASALLAELLDRHVTVASGVISPGVARDGVTSAIRGDFSSLDGLVRALAVHRDVSPRTLDAVVSVGELASSRIVAAALAERGMPTEWVDARTIVITNDEHTAAVPDMDKTCRRAVVTLGPLMAAGRVPVLGGFIASTPLGATTTLGRGGSDYSAAIVGACCDVDEIQIWTDVDGMLTADPRVVHSPMLVPELSFHEASELAYFGAKVLHPSTILPAVSKDIPVRILNSRRPENTGTSITAESRATTPLTALACKRDVTVVDITSTRMLMAYGFLRRVFEVFERFKTAVDVVTTSEVSVSVTVDDTRRLDDIVDNLRHFAEVSCENGMAIICAVGENLRTDPALFGQAVTALDRIALRLVSQAASRRNITFVLKDADVPDAMNRLHDQFFSVVKTA